MAFDVKQFLDFEGLSQYDELIKSYIKEQAQNTSSDADEKIEALAERVDDNAKALEVLNGEGEGSVKKAVEDAVSAVVDGAPEIFDTLKEIASWIEDDETGTASLITRVSDAEAAIEALEQSDKDIYEYIDSHDMAVYDSIQSIQDFKIASLFAVMQAEDEDVATVLAGIEEGQAVKLLANQEVAEDLVIDKSCFIDANGATFTGTVTVPANAEVVIENAVFSNPVVMA